MKKLQFLRITFILWIVLFQFLGCDNSETFKQPRTILFDQEWRFIKADPKGAELADFDDSGWRPLDLPHDWSIEDLPGQNEDSVVGPFSKVSIGRMGTGYTIGGTAWYRKHFVIDSSDRQKTAYLQFDGVYMNADVWINGQHIGNHPYGYTSFWYDITSFLNPAGQSNVIAVQVKNEGINARWYSGSGIYRHTWLTLVNPVHIVPWGVFVTTPDISEQSATVNIETTIKNVGSTNVPVFYNVTIIGPSGDIVGKSKMESSVIKNNQAELNLNIKVENPFLWSVDDPNLYQAKVEVLVDNKVADTYLTSFGIRTLNFDPQTGFSLNGETMLLKGGCFHHDNGPLGAAAIDRAEERKIEILKKAGFNAIRCSHNPPSPYLLDVCDRLGMLVIDEAFDMWEIPKMGGAAEVFGGEVMDTEEYSLYFKEWWQKDIQSMLLRDRNHPSIIMWSIGNEIHEAADSSGLRIATNLVNEVKKYDTTRPVTEAHVEMGAQMGRPSTWEQRAPHLALMDVIGYNYGFTKYAEDHKNHPERIMYASEFMPPQSLENWQTVEDLPYVIGNFSWTAMDYIGEAGTGIPRLVDDKPVEDNEFPFAQIMQFFDQNSWPMYVNFQGDIDLIGNPKTAYYYQHVVWRDHKLSMFVHKPIPKGKKEVASPWGFPDELKSWNWEGHEGEKMLVHVYTRSERVRLVLNGEVIGEQTVDDSKSITATFEVPYEPGTLTAYCFDDGNEISSETIKTSGKPAAIRLTADRSTIKADRNDLSYVMAEIVDTEGNVVPNADGILVNFKISGKGEIAGVGSGSPTDMSSFQQPRKKTWQGRCLAIIRPLGNKPGEILLTANSIGLKETTIKIIVE